MAETVEKTGKTVALALEAALRELGVSASEVDYEVLSVPTKGLLGIFGAKPAKVRVRLKEAVSPPNVVEVATDSAEVPDDGRVPTEEALTETEEPVPIASADTANVALAKGKSFLQEVFAAIKLSVTIETEDTPEGHVCHLVGDDLGILIGKHGQTLDALQYLSNIVANRNLTGERVRLILDVENYRKRREETLQNLAKRLAEKALRLRSEVRLEPMNRHERKIIHMTLQENNRVSTYSDGEEPHRCVIIVPNRGKK